MSDVTNVFKALVKTTKIRLKAQGELNSNGSILKTSNSTEISKKAKEVIGLITELKNHLLENRKAYLNVATYVSLNSGTPFMNDSERDRIDSNSEECIKTCRQFIAQFKFFVSQKYSSLDSQASLHQHTVVDILEKYLQDVCKIYTEQRAIRIKRVVERKRAFRLEPEPGQGHRRLVGRTHEHSPSFSLQERSPSPKSHKKSSDFDPCPSRQGDKYRSSSPDREVQSPTGWASPNLSAIEDENEPGSGTGATESRSPAGAKPVNSSLFWEEEGPEENMSMEEEQELALENKAIFADMATMAEEVRQLEGRVVEISHLQDVFSEKVLQQQGDVERISAMAVSSSEDIKDASMNIREAMKNNAGLRFWVLFIIIVMTLTMLFLDWYNP